MLTTALRLSLPNTVRCAAIRPALLPSTRLYTNIPRTPTAVSSEDNSDSKWDQNEAVLLHEAHDSLADVNTSKVFSTDGGHSSQIHVQETVGLENELFAPSLNIVFDE